MIFRSSNDSYEAYITFASGEDAAKTLAQAKTNDILSNPKLIDSRNVQDDSFDFLPPSDEREIVARKPPTPFWFVGVLKRDSTNLIKASEYIQRKIGTLPQGHLKRYGRNMLIRAGNSTQVHMLTNFRPTDDGNVEKVFPHKIFNSVKGVVYSKDLYEYSEIEILNKCPPSVYDVKKLKGSNNAIVLSFSTNTLPIDICIEHSTIKVRKFKHRPTQCFNCFEYGHVKSNCANHIRCCTCSGIHDLDIQCELPKYCLHCEGNHSPNSRLCTIYKQEENIAEVSYNEKVSFGAARQILGISKRSYAYAIRASMKTDNTKNNKFCEDPLSSNKSSNEEKECLSKALEEPAPMDCCLNKGSDLLSVSSNTVTHNRFDCLSTSNDNDVEADDDVSIASSVETSTTIQPNPNPKNSSKKRGIEQSTPPKNKKSNNQKHNEVLNTSDAEIAGCTEGDDFSSSAKSSPLTHIQPELSSRVLKPEEVEIHIDASNKSGTDEVEDDITPSPIIGRTTKSVFPQSITHLN